MHFISAEASLVCVKPLSRWVPIDLICYIPWHGHAREIVANLILQLSEQIVQVLGEMICRVKPEGGRKNWVKEVPTPVSSKVPQRSPMSLIV